MVSKFNNLFCNIKLWDKDIDHAHRVFTLWLTEIQGLRDLIMKFINSCT